MSTIPAALESGVSVSTVADLAALLATLPPDLRVEGLADDLVAVRYHPAYAGTSSDSGYPAYIEISDYDLACTLLPNVADYLAQTTPTTA